MQFKMKWHRNMNNYKLLSVLWILFMPVITNHRPSFINNNRNSYSYYSIIKSSKKYCFVVSLKWMAAFQFLWKVFLNPKFWSLNLCLSLSYWWPLILWRIIFDWFDFFVTTLDLEQCVYWNSMIHKRIYIIWCLSSMEKVTATSEVQQTWIKNQESTFYISSELFFSFRF